MTTLTELAKLVGTTSASAAAAYPEQSTGHGATGAHKAHVVGDSSVQISSVGLDSAAAEPGGLFAALPGTRTHGAAYAASAAASAILTDQRGLKILTEAGERRPVLVVDDVRAVLGTISAEIYGHPSQRLTVLGVTGTSGKTTTSYLLEAGLLAAGYSVGLIGTTGTRINREPVATKLTTPEAPTLQALFARMVAQGVTHVVMEVSSHALELGRVQGTEFAVGGFTNLSQDHLDFHPTMEDYFAAKARLFTGADAAKKAVICVDDDWGVRMADIAQAAHPVTRVATQPVRRAPLVDAALTGTPAAVTARQVGVEPSGEQQIELATSQGSFTFTFPLPGEFNIANAALAVGMALAVGVDIKAFITALAHVAVPGRMERVDQGQDFLAVVDYAHKPAAVAAVLDTLREQLDGPDGTGGRVGVAVGAGGDRDSLKRPLMGAAAATRADFVVVTDDNPRTEDPASIRQAVLAGARKAAESTSRSVEVAEIGSRAEAIDALVRWARPGDAIIVVGKGHEVGQIVGDRTLHFDDREELARALRKEHA